MENLHILSFYVTHFQVTISNLEYGNYFKKVFTEMSFHVRRFLAFNANELLHDQNQGIVCDNAPILCTWVHLGMKNNVVKGTFPFPCTKIPFFIFQLPKSCSFVKHLQEMSLEKASPHFK